MDVLYEFLYLLSLAEILLISFIFGMVETCRQNQFVESYKTSLRSEKFWKMCLQKYLKKSGFFGRDHFCQFWIVCPKVTDNSSYKIHQNPKQMWISSLFFQFQLQNDKKGAALEVVQTTFKKRDVAIIVRCCHAHHLLQFANIV